MRLEHRIFIAAALLAGCASTIEVTPGGVTTSSSMSASASSGAASGGVGGSGGATEVTGTGGTGGSGGATSTSVGSGGTGGATSTGGGGAGGGAGGDPGPGPGDVLDPTEVYLLGTLVEGACYRDALARWSNPNTASVGFDCYVDEIHATIRPTDGRLLYTNTFEELVREFHCDGCTYDGTYPSQPLANDTVLPTPPCQAGGFYELAFTVGPEGDVLHTCTTDPLVWYREDGTLAYDDAGDALLHLGFGGRALTMHRIFDLGTQTGVNLSGLPYVPILTARALAPDGFRVVLDGGSGPPELWQIDAMGAATMVGVYPEAPTGYSVDAKSSRLDASGALFQFARSGPTDVIVRRQVGGTSDVVYSEASHPLVKIHISALVTGP